MFTLFLRLWAESKRYIFHWEAIWEIGMRLFGLVLWAASITSVIGAAFTSISFVTTTDTSPITRQWLTVAFIAVCAAIYALLGQAPQAILIFAGAFNGLILPVGFGLLLWVAWRRADLAIGFPSAAPY